MRCITEGVFIRLRAIELRKLSKLQVISHNIPAAIPGVYTAIGPTGFYFASTISVTVQSYDGNPRRHIVSVVNAIAQRSDLISKHEGGQRLFIPVF